MIEQSEIVKSMKNRGFRLRLHPWDESKRDIMVVGFDVPKFVDSELPPQQPPAGFFFCRNDPDSILKTVTYSARKSRSFSLRPYFVQAVVVAFWNTVYYYFPHDLTKNRMSSSWIYNWMKNEERHLEDLSRIKFWKDSNRVGNNACLDPLIA